MGRRAAIFKISPYEDARGALKKVFTKDRLASGEVVEEIYVLYTEKGCVRGNHYHMSNVEYFTVLKGSAAIALKDIDEGNVEIIKVSAEDNMVIKVPEKVAHGFRNDGEGELIILAVALKQYDPLDTDTYTFQLL